MKFSKRVQSLTTSPIRKLSPYAAAAEKKGKKIYHLNIGQPDIATPSNFMEEIRRKSHFLWSFPRGSETHQSHCRLL